MADKKTTFGNSFSALMNSTTIEKDEKKMGRPATGRTSKAVTLMINNDLMPYYKRVKWLREKPFSEVINDYLMMMREKDIKSGAYDPSKWETPEQMEALKK